MRKSLTVRSHEVINKMVCTISPLSQENELKPSNSTHISIYMQPLPTFAFVIAVASSRNSFP